MTNSYKNNLKIRIIYGGLGFIVDIIDYLLIDYLDYEYMIEWRNQMMSWRRELEKRYYWVGQRERGYPTKEEIKK